VVGNWSDPFLNSFAVPRWHRRRITVNKFGDECAGIWAAGDIASYPDQIFHRRMRVTLDNAVEQGRVAMRNLWELFSHLSTFLILLGCF